jgi:class 3 adenylate cyclase
MSMFSSMGGAMVDRFMGDQIVGYFVPLYAPAHARSAIETGLALLSATQEGPGRAPWIPVGVGVHTGRAFVGTVGRPGRERSRRRARFAKRLGSALAAHSVTTRSFGCGM